MGKTKSSETPTTKYIKKRKCLIRESGYITPLRKGFSSNPEIETFFLTSSPNFFFTNSGKDGKVEINSMKTFLVKCCLQITVLKMSKYPGLSNRTFLHRNTVKIYSYGKCMINLKRDHPTFLQ